MQISIAASLPSRYAIGEVVYFHPEITDMNPEEAERRAILAQIISVSFSQSKVKYELALDTSVDPGEPEFYDALPVAGVDSYFVKSKADVADMFALDSDTFRADAVSIDPELQENMMRRFEAIAADLPELRKAVANSR